MSAAGISGTGDDGRGGMPGVRTILICSGRNMSIIMTTNAAADTIMKSMSITTITSAAADTIMKSMNIIMTTNAVAGHDHEEHEHDHECGCGHDHEEHEHHHNHECGCGNHHHDHHHHADEVFTSWGRETVKSIPERILKRSLLPFLSQGSMA